MEQEQKAPETEPSSRRRIPFPILINDPTNGLDFGGGFLGLYRLNKVSEEDSQTDVFGYYTTTKSWKVGFDQVFSFKEDRFRSKTSGRFGNVNNRFEYPNLPSDVVYGEPMNVLTSNFVYNFVGRLYANVNYRYIKTDYVFDTGTDEEQEFSQAILGRAGAEEAAGSGLGLVAGHDSRDHEYSATKGIYTDLQWLSFREWMGSDDDYSTVETFFNFYWSVKKSQVLAFRFRWRCAHGDVPFNGQSTFSGVDLRGYPTGKYRGDGIIAGQVEYRFPIWKRVSGVAFGGSGRVYGDSKTLGADQILPSGGAWHSFPAPRRPRRQHWPRLRLREGRQFGSVFPLRRVFLSRPAAQVISKPGPSPVSEPAASPRLKDALA